MKLGELRGAIRKTKGNPYMEAYPFPGTDGGFRFVLQKTPLLEELERAYPGGKAVETGLTFDPETGHLKPSADGIVFTAVTKRAEPAGAAADLIDDAPASDDGLLDLDDTPIAAPVA